ncbi:hypothetical protein E2C01_047306 [Portunus trituberculatus]|uniref:Uncharacterized protein n=1 Tax=Portunus trituberculatus TaxID=210409 RepID=A0A5B7G7D3_PORTR|nr:hypothetical protein [Portunus trituberculatus]
MEGISGCCSPLSIDLCSIRHNEYEKRFLVLKGLRKRSNLASQPASQQPSQSTTQAVREARKVFVILVVLFVHINSIKKYSGPDPLDQTRPEKTREDHLCCS